MRFSRFGDYEFTDTNRKRLAVLRRQKAERERYPLFADEIAAEQVDVDTEMNQRRISWEKHICAERRERATKWREVRARLWLRPHEQRKALLAYWQRCRWPADPTYLASMLTMYDAGRLDLNPPVLTETDFRRDAVQATIDRIRASKQASIAGHGQMLTAPPILPLFSLS